MSAALQRRLKEAGPIILVGTGLLVAGNSFADHPPQLAWPLVILGTVITLVGLAWAPAALLAPTVLRVTLARAVAAQLDAEALAEVLAPRITGELELEMPKPVPPPSATDIALAVIAELERRTSLPSVDQSRREQRRIIVHDVISVLEAQLAKLDVLSLSTLNPHWHGVWDDRESYDLLAGNPIYDTAVRETERAFLAISRIDPQWSFFPTRAAQLAQAQQQIGRAVAELNAAKDQDVPLPDL